MCVTASNNLRSVLILCDSIHEDANVEFFFEAFI